MSTVKEEETISGNYGLNNDYLNKRIGFGEGGSTKYFNIVRTGLVCIDEQLDPGFAESGLKDEFLATRHRDDGYKGKLVLTEGPNKGYLGKHVILNALLNILQIDNKQSSRNKYLKLVPFYKDENLIIKGTSGALSDPKFKPNLIQLIQYVNEDLKKEGCLFSVPVDIFDMRFKKLIDIYKCIEGNFVAHNKQIVEVKTPLVTGKSHEALWSNYLEHNSIVPKSSIGNRYSGKSNLDRTFDKLSRFLATEKHTKKGELPLTGERFAYMVGDSDLICGKLLKEYFNKVKNRHTYGTVLFVDISRITKQTTFLRYLNFSLMGKNSKNDIDQLNRSSYTELKAMAHVLLKERADIAGNGVIFVLVSRVSGVIPRNSEMASTVMRSGTEHTLNELTRELESTGNPARVICGVKGGFQGYKSPHSTKINYPAITKPIWESFCLENAKSNKSQTFAFRVINSAAEADLTASTVSALISLDNMIEFAKKTDSKAHIMKNRKQHTFDSTKYFMGGIDWREDLYNGMSNHRLPMKFAKILAYYFIAEKKTLWKYMLLLCTAYSDNGLTQESMLQICHTLGYVDVDEKDILEFIADIESISITVHTDKIEIQDPLEWEIIEPLRAALVVHGHSYFEDKEHVARMKKAYYGIEKDADVEHSSLEIKSSEELHLAIARRAITLDMEKADESHPDHVRARESFQIIAIKHLLKAVSAEAKFEMHPKGKLTLEGYLHVILKEDFEAIAPVHLVNCAWRIFYHIYQGQSEENINHQFDMATSLDNPLLIKEILNLFDSVAYKHRARGHHVPPLLSECLDDESLLNKCNTEAVVYWSNADLQGGFASWDFYNTYFKKYQAYTPDEAIALFLNGQKLPVYARESMSRPMMYHVRGLHEQGQNFRAKVLSKEMLEDLKSLLRSCSIELMRLTSNDNMLVVDVPVARKRLADYMRKNRSIKDPKPLIDTYGLKKANLEFKRNLLVEIMRKCVKRIIRYTASLIHCTTAMGNFESGHKYFLKVHVVASDPINYIISLIPEEERIVGNMEILEMVLKEHETQFNIPLQNRTIYHSLHFISMKEQYLRTTLERGDFVHSKKGEKYGPQDRVLFYERAVTHDVYDRKGGEKLRKMYGIKFKNMPQSKSKDYTYSALRQKTIEYAQSFIDAQSNYLRASHVTSPTANKTAKQQIADTDAKYQGYSIKLEEYLLVLMILRRSIMAKIISEDEIFQSLKERGCPVHSLKLLSNEIDFLAEHPALRFSNQMYNKLQLEAYRQKVILRQGQNMNLETWDREKHEPRRIERNLSTSGSYSALLELYILKAWNIKFFMIEANYRLRRGNKETKRIATLELEELEARFDHVISNASDITERHLLKLRELDMSLLRDPNELKMTKAPIAVR